MTSGSSAARRPIFACNYRRDDREISDLVADGVHATLAAAGVDPTDIECIHVGNAFGELFAGQGHLGAMPATVVPELWGVPRRGTKPPARRAASRRSSAMADIEAGRYDCVLVLGVEQERNVSGADAARHLGAAAWIGHEGETATFMWPHTFSLLGDEYDRRYGLDDAHLAAIAELNFRNARANPNAQTRDWAITTESFGADDSLNPVVEGRIRRHDCSQVTDGAAGVVLVSRTVHGRPRGLIADRVAADHRVGPPDCRAAVRGQDRSQPRRAVRVSARAPRDRRCVRAAPGSRTSTATRGHRDARLLHDERVHGHRPLRDHRAGRELEGDRTAATSSATARCR